MITPFFAGILALMFLGLSFNVIVKRFKYRVSLGDGGHGPLNRAIRVHANFAEYVPFALLLMLMLEMQGFSGATLYPLGAALVAGRVAHAYGLSAAGGTGWPRRAGMIATYTVMVVACGLLLFRFL